MNQTNRTRCALCGHSHAALGIEIRARVLFRTADSTRGQMLTKIAGGAWAFRAEVLERHAADVERVLIYDKATGITYASALREWFEHGFTKDMGAGLQRILPLANFETDRPTPRAARFPAQGIPRDDMVQPILIQSKEITGAIRTPAKSKRPRIFKPRRWGC